MARLRIRELAEAQGLNITEVSRRARISYTTAHKLWHDRAENLNKRNLEKIAKVLGVHVGDLFAEDTEEG